MKKKTFNFLVLSGLLSSFIFSLLSCTFEITDKKRINDPDLDNSEMGIIVSLKNSNQDTLYVNIYRQDVTNVLNEKAADKEPTVCIGIVFPIEKSNSTSNATFVYEDSYVTSGRKYRYCARLYSEVDGYTYTNWTPFFEAKGGLLEENSTFYYGISEEARFVYNELTKSITVEGDIFAPTGLPDGVYEESFTPALVFQSKSCGTKVFQIENISENPVIYLTSLLPLDFHDTEIKLLGIVGQKIVTYTAPKSDTKKTQKVIWTKMSSITLCDKDHLAIPNNAISIVSEHGADGFDYSY